MGGGALRTVLLNLYAQSGIAVSDGGGWGISYGMSHGGQRSGAGVMR